MINKKFSYSDPEKSAWSWNATHLFLKTFLSIKTTYV